MEFVKQVRQEVERNEHESRGGNRWAMSLKGLVERVCQVKGVRVESVEGGLTRQYSMSSTVSRFARNPATD